MRKLAYQLAERNGMLEANKGCYANKDSFGQDWLKGFLRRHTEITSRTPEATSAARAHGFNREAVAKFFDTHESLMDKYKFPANNIYICGLQSTD